MTKKIKTTFSLLETKVQIWQKVQEKISKISILAMEIYTTALASVRKSCVCFSYGCSWSPVAKNEVEFN